MTFRPIDDHMLLVCKEQAHCLDCPLRKGCLLRWSFYQMMNQSQFESWLKQISHATNIDPNLLHMRILMLQYKRIVELLNRPRYEY